MRHLTLLAISVLFEVGSTLAIGATPTQSTVHTLPALPSSVPKSVGQIRLHAYQAHDRGGNFIDVPAHLVDVQGFTGDWVSPDPTRIPSFPEPLPEQLGNKIQLFYNSGKYNASAGWMVVPRNWELISAGIGSDFTSFEFAAPDGPASGWMMMSFSYCPRSDCVLNDLAGLLPGAKDALTWAYQNRNFPETLPPDAKLEPKLTSISHPNPCSALFKYSQNHTVIYGAVLLDGSSGNLGDSSLYITSAGTVERVANHITRSFIKYQMRRNSYQYCQARTTLQH